MGLTPGRTLAHYEILGPLGSGAMGEVYRAMDTRLEREVALKVLPEGFAEDEERLRRFEREAKSLAALNHPNIAQIFGVDQHDETTFLVLELVPGQTLAERIARGPLSTDDAVDLCAQIATALEAAHEAGVIHRDLKPANVRITPDGKAKVLDFGLAKPTYAQDGSGSGPATDSVLSTEAGRLIGTPTYMAPEQARGRPIDRRVDVWAFGCVLFECLTGVRPFAGETLGDVLVAVLEREPDWARLSSTTPRHVRALLERCLDKDPRERLRDIGEARITLSRPAATVTTERGFGGRSLARSAPWIAVAIAVGAVAGRLSVSSDTPAPFRQHRLTEMEGIEQMPAISPSGAQVAFVARVDGYRQIFVRLLPDGSPTPVTQENADHSFPRWVDDTTLLYRRSDEEGEPGMFYEALFPSGSLPEPIAKAETEVDVDVQGRWLATFRRDDDGPALVLVDREGLEPDQVTPLEDATYRTPRWSPDGRHIAFEAFPYLLKAEICVIDLRAGGRRTLARASQTRGLAWLPDGSGLVYASSKGSTLTYPPVFTLRTVHLDGSGDAPLPFGGAGYASYEQPDVSAAGQLVACRVDLDSNIYRYPVGGSARENTDAEEQITHQTGLVQVPSVSPSGDAVVYLSDRGGHANLWVKRLDDPTPRQITKERDPDTTVAIAVWGPAGDRIVYVHTPGDGDSELRLVNADGRGAPELLVSHGVGPAWSHDGEWVYYTDVTDPVLDSYRVSVLTREKQLIRSDAVGLVLTQDGETAYFLSSADEMGQVWRASPPDATPTRHGPDLNSRVPLLPHQWVLSPDEEWLASPLEDGETTNLYKLSTKDGELVRVTDFGARRTLIGRQISWSTDGFLYAAVMEPDSDIVLLEGALQ